jgi:hypothetical protein
MADFFPGTKPDNAAPFKAAGSKNSPNAGRAPQVVQRKDLPPQRNFTNPYAKKTK